MAKIFLFFLLAWFSNLSFSGDCAEVVNNRSFNSDQIKAMRAAYKEMIKTPILGSDEQKNKLTVRLEQDRNFFMIYFEKDKKIDFSPQDIKGVVFTVSKETLEVILAKELPYSDPPEQIEK